MTSRDYQAQNDSQNETKKGMMDYNTSNTLLAEIKF